MLFQHGDQVVCNSKQITGLKTCLIYNLVQGEDIVIYHTEISFDGQNFHGFHSFKLNHKSLPGNLT